MKNKQKYIIAVSITLIGVFTGLLMPQMICCFQDKKLVSQIKNEEYKGSATEQTTIDKLELIARGYSSLPLESGIHMSEQEALQTAEIELKKFILSDVLFTGKKATEVFLAVSSENSAVVAVFWKVELIFDEGNAIVIIDDEMKKIVSFRFSEIVYDFYSVEYSEDEYQNFINDFAVLCSEYYGLEIERIECLEDNYLYAVTFKSNTRSIEIHITFSINSYSFNE